MDQLTFFTASRIVIVAGKGGVGKTTVSAGLAMAAAQIGLKVLFVELDVKPGAERIFGCSSPLGYESTEIALIDPKSGAGHITARRITAQAALSDYLDTHGLPYVHPTFALHQSMGCHESHMSRRLPCHGLSMGCHESHMSRRLP